VYAAPRADVPSARIPPRVFPLIENSTRMPEPIPARISDDGRVATWNPAMTFAPQVLVRVRLADGSMEERRSMNSGRSRVREGEAIVSILAEERL
jgi:hypothetical protein